ncbi:MAG: hypothetical protein M1829_003025, partial [Trizodia sp. TS-e1964]
MDLSAPTEEVFASKDELVAHFEAHAFTHGYALRKEGSNLQRITLKCNRSGVYESKSS